MSGSPTGLLQRLQQTGDAAAWGRLVDLYSAHLFLWACRAGLPGAEAADLVRDVFAAIAQKLPEYRTTSPGGFRAWLRTLAHARRRELLAKQKVPAGHAAPDAASPVPAVADDLWEGEYLPFLLRAAVELMQPEFPPSDWKACWGVAIEGRPAADVARELGLTVAAVYAAEARVLRRLRQELDGLLN
jgi:RNA polymerase sigma-70 factor (ECF subfamily)